MSGRTIIVGDVHGCADELDDLYRTLAVDLCSDQLVFVGDLVAKGPDSRGVLARARQWGAQAVLGNHEDVLLSLRDQDGAPPSAPAPDQRPPTAHQQLAASLSQEDWAQLSAMPLFLELAAGVVVHAGIVPGVPLGAQRRADLLRMRTLTASGEASARHNAGPLWAAAYRGPPFVFFGHHARQGLQVHAHALGLDTGCVYGRALTAAVLPAGELAQRELVSVPARRAYASTAANSAHKVGNPSGSVPA